MKMMLLSSTEIAPLEVGALETRSILDQQMTNMAKTRIKGFFWHNLMTLSSVLETWVLIHFHLQHLLAPQSSQSNQGLQWVNPVRMMPSVINHQSHVFCVTSLKWEGGGVHRTFTILWGVFRFDFHWFYDTDPSSVHITVQNTSFFILANIFLTTFNH